MNKKDASVSYSFEKLYEPSKQHFNLEKIRDKNIKKLSEIIDEIENVEKSYAELKRQKLIEIEKDETIEDKDKAIDDEFEKINDCIYADKKAFTRALKNEIRHQVKRLLYLDEPKKKYEYYKLISTNPLREPYFEMESEIYSEFLNRNPSILNIIVSYSMLEDENTIRKDNNDEINDKINGLLQKAEKDSDENALNEAYLLIKTLPDGKDKDDFIKRAEDIQERIKGYDNKEVKTATELVEEAESMGYTYPVKKGADKIIQEANVLVQKLDKSPVRTELLERLIKLVKSMTKTFMDEFRKVEYKFANQKDVSYEEIVNLRNLFNELHKDEISDLGFKMAGADGYGNRLSELIKTYNMQAQDNLRKNKDSKEKQKMGFLGKLSSIKDSIVSKIAAKRLNIIERKLNKAKEQEDEQKISKYQEKYDKYASYQSMIDNVSSVALLKNQDTFDELKDEVYANGIGSLEEKQADKFDEAIEKIGSIKLRGLTKLTKNDFDITNKDKVRSIIKQYIELLSIAHDNQTYKEHWYNKGQNIEMIEKVKADAESFISDAYEAGSLSDAEYNAYMEAIEFIYKYRLVSKYDIYKVKHDENDELVNVNDAIDYYKNPVTYSDMDNGEKIRIPIPHIIKKNK